MSIRFLFTGTERQAHGHNAADLRLLPRLRRLLHPKTHRHLFAVLLGASISLTGSYLATHAGIAEAHVPHWVWDGFAYTVHAVGLGPIIAHVDPLWKILMAD
jgi:hypothetical protein